MRMLNLQFVLYYIFPYVSSAQNHVKEESVITLLVVMSFLPVLECVQLYIESKLNESFAAIVYGRINLLPFKLCRSTTFLCAFIVAAFGYHS